MNEKDYEMSIKNDPNYVKFATAIDDYTLELFKDAARYRFLRDMKPNSYTLSYNDGHKPNYMSVEEWIASSHGMYDEITDETRQKMIDTDTIWTLQIYPNTPIGFNWYHGATMNEAIDAAMAESA